MIKNQKMKIKSMKSKDKKIMKKKALLVYGIPNEKDDKIEFQKNCERNINLMSEIAKASGYNEIDKTSHFGLTAKLKEYTDVDSFLFYFTGHSSNSALGDYSNSLDGFFNSIKDINGEKIVILDSCTEEYIKLKKFPKKTKVFGGHKIYDNTALAKLFYDAVIYYKKNLDEIEKNTFDEMKQNWVYFNKGI